MTNSAPERTVRCISPVDGSLYAERPLAAFDEARQAVEDARQSFAGWAKRPLEERIALVRAGVEQLASTSAEAVPELAHMMGRPVRFRGEFSGVSERACHMADIAADALSPVVVENSDRFERRIVREPHGVVLVIAPWNYPYLTAINTVAPALIAGNAVVLKHSSQTLLAGERMERAFAESGFPEKVFRNLFLDHAATLGLIESRAVDFVNFTGSVEAGRNIERAAAGTFTPVSLELGGKDPGYVAGDMDPAVAAEGLVDAAMFNSGQCCCGIERIYVHKSRYKDFVEAAVAAASALKLGTPLEEETTLGPMANRRFADNVRRQTADAVASGATAAIDPKRFPADDGGTYLMPQILTNATHEMDVMRTESFGPVVGIMEVENDSKAVELMNDSEYGLTASLWTTDPERASAIGAQLDTGTVFMNRADYLDPALCWTGRKNTGRGGALSAIGFHNLTKPKSYHLRKGIQWR